MRPDEKGAALQDKKAVEAAERAEQEAQELKEFRSRLTFKVTTFRGNSMRLNRAPACQGRFGAT